MSKNIFLVLICTICFEIAALSQELVVDGKWKYTLEDNKEFSKPGYDDSNWGELEKPYWKDGINRTANRELWVRKRLVIPSSLKSEFEKTGAITLSMGKIQQSDNTFLNGKQIGSTGSGDSYRNYLIKMDDILWDQENVIAIRVRHWGVFGMSIVPKFVAAAPQHLFAYSAGIKNGDGKAPVQKRDLVYHLSVTNKSIKVAEGIVNADFYDFSGTKIHSANKKVSLNIGENFIEFPYTSQSPFLKIVYSVSIPSYNYTGEWNGEFGYENIAYKKVTPIVGYKADQNYLPANFDFLKIDGWLGEKLKINTTKRLYNVDEKEMLAGFINRPGSHSWIGEHIGKFLEAACNSYANNADEALKVQIDRSAQQLIAAQLSDGYLGTYPMDSHWTSWDVWSHKYDLVGLLRYYELSGFKPALDASIKIGDLLTKKFGTGEGQKDIIRSGAHVGMAATSVLDPMTDLYRFTGNQKYLDFCFYIIKSYNNPNGPRIISTLDSLGRVDKVANAKSYEMLTNLVGVVKLYRITNDPKFLKPVVTAWNDIVAKRLYVTGTASSFEHFHDDHILPAEANSNMGEGCVTTTWVQINYQLFCIFGDIKYLNELERTVYNHLVGAQNPQNGDVSYYTPLNGVKPYRDVITCCMSSIPRGIAMVPMFANGLINGQPAFLFYQSGVYRPLVGNSVVEFVTNTHFPANGQVTITVNPIKSANFKVFLRKPYWSTDFSVSVNGQKQPSASELVAIDRKWKTGDKIEVRFNISVKALDGNISYPGHIALQRGPHVLVFDQKLNSVQAKDVVLLPESIQLEDASAVLPANWVGAQAYQLNARVNGEVQKIVLVPYADAGQTGGNITTWLKKN